MLKTSLDAFQNANSRHGFPPCTAVELVGLKILDSTGLPFAVVARRCPTFEWRRAVLIPVVTAVRLAASVDFHCRIRPGPGM